MKWLFSFWRLSRQPPPIRKLPELLLKCAVWGALSGPFWAAFFTAFHDGEAALQIFITPRALFWSAACGIVFAWAFFIACGLGNCYVRRLVTGYPPMIVRVIAVVYNAIAASLACAVSFSVVTRLPTGVRIEVPYFSQIVMIDGVIGGVLALIIGAFIKLKSQVEDSQTKLREQELAVRELAVTASQAQARVLQSQINPHFFFNTLNTISALIDEDPAAARQMIGRLADLFRYTFGCSNADAVSLCEEVQFVRDYLSIERARFRKRLQIELPEGILPDVRIPGLVLQPLVENAIKYGIAPRIEGGSVSVAIAPSAVGIRVSVRNTTDDNHLPEMAKMIRPGHALENVQSRLRLFTGEPEPLRMDRGADWVEFSFEAPLAVRA